MKIHRFILDFDKDSAQVKINDKDIIKQIIHVLRLKAGDLIIICDGKGYAAEAKITCMNDNVISLESVKAVKEHAPQTEIILYCSMLKKENFEFVVQKATEIGVSTIVPVISKRTVKLNFKYFRLQNIMREAAEQSGRSIVPLLCHHMFFQEAVHDAVNNKMNFFFDITGKDFSLANKDPGLSKKFGIFIGPEGGWSPEETRIAQEKKFSFVNLGKFTLRAETAAIIAVYVVCRSINM